MSLSDPQFKNVLDLNAARQVKKMTGTGKAIPIDKGEPFSPKTEQHIKDMLELNKPPKMSLTEKLGRKMGLWED